MARINKDSLDRFFDYGINVDTRTIYASSIESDLDGNESGVDSLMCEKLIKGLHVLDKSAPAGDNAITIILNSPGGDSLYGMSCYDAIKLCKNHVTVMIQGYGMSIAAWILQAADRRVMTKNSRLMIHTGHYTLGYNHPEINKRLVEQFARDEEIFENILLEKIKIKHPDFTKAKIKSMLRFDTILTPEEALNLGLIDEIV